MATFRHFERLRPEELDEALRDAPIAFVPLGSIEFHGWHLPLGFDALKAAALCERVAAETGGVVMPPTFFGFAGLHGEYHGSIISEEAPFEAHLRVMLQRLAVMGFKVIVVLTGHYPGEQVAAAKRVADEASAAWSDVTIFALAEHEAYPNEMRGDHAAKWETSIALEIMPELVNLEALDDNPEPLHGIYGEDPRSEASVELGKETVDTIVSTLAGIVHGALRLRRKR